MVIFIIIFIIAPSFYARHVAGFIFWNPLLYFYYVYLAILRHHAVINLMDFS